MQVYLPIAEMSMSIPLLVLLGGGIGFLSGLFGVGGGFLLTPLLIVAGVPPAIAVGTQANQSVAGACAGMLGHQRGRNVDIRLGLVLLVGSLIGTLIGNEIFGWLKTMGLIDFIIAVLYVLFLGFIGGMMLFESLRSWMRRRWMPQLQIAPRKIPAFFEKLPFKITFPASKIEVSILVPLTIGLVTGITTVILGLGGSLLVPAMIYLLAMPMALVAGTSLFQVIFTAGSATFLQAVTHHTVDIMLALPLMAGSVVGAQIGSRLAGKLRPELARGILALIIFLVAVNLLFNLMVEPKMPYSWEVLS